MSILDPEQSPPSARCAEPKTEPTDDGEPKPTENDRAIAVWGVTELRFTTEPELLVMSDQVREPATMPAARKGKAVDSESTERSSALCTMAARNLECWRPLSVLSPCQAQRGLPFPHLAQGGPRSPSQTRKSSYFTHPAKRGLLLPIQPAEIYSVPEVRPGVTASVPEFGQERASVPKIGPERASIPVFSTERAPVPELGPERALVS